jgi:hypothetical protein
MTAQARVAERSCKTVGEESDGPTPTSPGSCAFMVGNDCLLPRFTFVVDAYFTDDSDGEPGAAPPYTAGFHHQLKLAGARNWLRRRRATSVHARRRPPRRRQR